MLDYVLAPLARRDLLQIHTGMSLHNVGAADRFMAAALSTFEQLVRFPKMGRSRSLELRLFPVKDFDSYMVFYRQGEHTLQIVRVLHGSRDLPAILPPSR